MRFARLRFSFVLSALILIPSVAQQTASSPQAIAVLQPADTDECCERFPYSRVF